MFLSKGHTLRNKNHIPGAPHLRGKHYTQNKGKIYGRRKSGGGKGKGGKARQLAISQEYSLNRRDQPYKAWIVSK